MNKYLLEKLEGKTPTFLNGNGGKRQGRGLFGLLLMLMALSMPLVGWGQITPTTDSNGNGTIEDSEKVLYLIQGNQVESFHMIPKGNDVSTANIPHTDMLWYFLEAENDNGTQYYYIVSNSTGKYICNTDYASSGRTIQLANFDSSSTDKFKFRLVENTTNGTTGFYNICIKPNGSQWIGLNKRNGNVSSQYPIRLTNDDNNHYINDANSKWRFIAFDNNHSWPNPPFTLSPGESKTYYKIRNIRNNSYYVSTGSGSPKYVTNATTESSDMAWYFKEAPYVDDADLNPMKLKYYYIINPAAGDQYMYFRGNVSTSDQTDAVEVKAKSSENEDRYQFFVVRAARVVSNNPVECYMIVPKLLIGNLWDSNSLGITTVSDGANLGIIKGRVSNNDNENYAHWTFEITDYSMQCTAPIITYSSETGKITITSTPDDAVIHYTTDGTDPSSSDGELYSAPFDVSTAVTIKAIASKTGYVNSEVVTVFFDQVATPTIQNNGSNAISITSTTEGVAIFYTTDGSTPTTASTLYTGPLTMNVSGVTIKAIAVKGGWINSAVGSGAVTLKCAKPYYTRSGDYLTISCAFPASGVTIYYTINGGDPTTSSSVYSSPIQVSIGDVIKAIATASAYDNSDVATITISEELLPDEDGKYHITNQADFATFVDMANTTDGAQYHYVLDANVTAVSEISVPFKGIFDGNAYTITGLTQPLFNTVEGGTVKNVTLKSVSISSSADAVGAIAGTAKGYSRIYNCGILPNSAGFPEGAHPTVATTGNCAGGIVGRLEDDSRVINCYSYADVSASTYASGIVGQNTFASDATVSNGKYINLRTAVVNCMFYGNITGGTNQYGVYGGELITNAASTGISSYNYYRKGTTFNAVNGHPSTSGGENTIGEPTAYNCSFPADERYLTQVEFHRSLLNSNRELCGWWVGSDVAPNTLTTAAVQAVPKDASLMYKWVVDPNLAPYPILKPFGKYPSIVNGNTGTPWFDRTTANPYEGKQLGTLMVTVKSGDHSSAADQTLILPITDMDTLHYDFGYNKVQLPYYNTVFGNPDGATWTEKYAGNYTDYVVTGWKVTAVDNAGTNSFEAHWEHGYNFADRKCTDKDLYSVSGRVFAQGGNYYVPDGVTAITIEAYWGEPIYVRNNGDSYDRVNITENNTGSHFAPAGIRDNNVNGATIYTQKIRDVIDRIPQKKTVYDYAIVLVGNVQESNSNNTVTNDSERTRGFTIMSVDLDFDEEPDYCLEWQLGTGVSRNTIAPIRFDFLPVVELGIAGKTHNSTYFFSLGCFRSYGHFEVTETSFIRFGQFEFELQTRDEGPIILNGGIYDQYCRGRNNESNQHINYVILGGHVVMPSFTPGAHVNVPAGVLKTRHCAVNALGGDFTSFYLTGGYNEQITPYEDNPHCYIDGGRFGTIAAAYKEGIWGDVTWRINHALIGEFYGGGVMSQATGNNYKIVKGSIDVVIDNSIVGKYCGGPKFGNMEPGKTVTTSATGTVFTRYYGAGNGGTNYVQYDNTDDSQHVSPYDASTWSGIVDARYHPGQYRSSDHSYEADYDYEVINTSTGTWAGNVINRSYYYSAQFATTNTGDVTSTLTDCIVKKNFYGGGFLGGVTGSVNSTLIDTQVYGSAFGAGYSASVDTVVIHNKDKNIPKVNIYTNMITYDPEGTSNTYYWSDSHGSTASPVTEPSPATHDTAYFYTELSLDNLGAVSIDATITIEGNSTIGTFENGVLKPNTGNVFGGGDESAVERNILVHIKDRTKVLGNVYGGGNMGRVGGNTKVIINGVTHDSNNGVVPDHNSSTGTVPTPHD
jgi:hypothetical protein